MKSVSINKEITVTALLSALILISGAFKIPSPLPGGEFQLSAPIAVLICALFGFKRYISAGIIASLLGLILGTANPLNVTVAMVFRIVAGIILYFGHNSYPAIAISGPLGTFSARIVLSLMTGISWKVLALAALPGMIFTAVVSVIFYKPAKKLLSIIL